uniref:Islet cell autoantigen 1-like n=1 Tax=Salmo trutta TaxID=8032 RepID=A0A674DM16_SALTR
MTFLCSRPVSGGLGYVEVGLGYVEVMLRLDLSQEENELGMFLSKGPVLVLCRPLQRMEQEVETFRRRAIADTLLTVTRMEKIQDGYRGALLWMKDVSQDIDPFQSQVRGSKDLFEKLKNDVCQKVDMLGASRCNMLSHSLCTYQVTLLQFWERTACVMRGIHEGFKGLVSYQFTALRVRGTGCSYITRVCVSLSSLTIVLFSNPVLSNHPPCSPALCDLSGNLSTASTDDDLLPLACDQPQPGLSSSMQASGPSTDHSSLWWSLGVWRCAAQQPHTSLSPWDSVLQQGPRVEEEEDRETGNMAFLKDLLSPGPMEADEFSRDWQGTFGCLEFSDPVPPTALTPTLVLPPPTGAACPPSQSPSPTGFLPSQLLDHSLSSTGWATPPMFQAPPLQSPVSCPKGASRDMSAWFNLFADLDPLSNPDVIGRSEDEILNA